VPQHVLQLPLLEWVALLEGVYDSLENVYDVVLRILGLHRRALLVDHVEHLILD